VRRVHHREVVRLVGQALAQRRVATDRLDRDGLAQQLREVGGDRRVLGANFFVRDAVGHALVDRKDQRLRQRRHRHQQQRDCAILETELHGILLAATRRRTRGEFGRERGPCALAGRAHSQVGVAFSTRQRDHAPLTRWR
jgi:hypothetical protein